MFKQEDNKYYYIDVLGVRGELIGKYTPPYNDNEYNYMKKREMLNKDVPKIRVSRDLWFESFMPKTYN